MNRYKNLFQLFSFINPYFPYRPPTILLWTHHITTSSYHQVYNNIIPSPFHHVSPAARWRRNYCHNAHHQRPERHYQKKVKWTQILPSYALPNPGTMVIVLVNAHVAVIAVVDPDCSDSLARLTKSRILFLLSSWIFNWVSKTGTR